jgi:Ser/Thr protein kinase RdoA (MazF antagonist)
VNLLRIQARTDIAPDQVKTLVEYYYGYRVGQIEKVRAVYKVQTDQGVFAFKNAVKIKDIQFIDEVIHHLHQNGFDRVPKLQKTSADELFIFFEGQKYVLEHWLPANVREVGVHREDWLFHAGEALAHFHRAIGSFSKSSISKKRMRSPWAEWFQEKYKKIKYTQPIRDESIKYWLLNRMKLAKMQLKKHPEITSHLCHGSLHQENIMIDNTRNIWLIDYERLTYDAKAKDIAQLLDYHFRFHPWSRKPVEALLSGYQSVSALQRGDLYHLCSRSLIPESMIYAYFDGKIAVKDGEQERRKEAVFKQLVPDYWKI